MTSNTYGDDLAFALTLADAADVVTMRHFQSPSLVVESKHDHTEVTIADRGTEETIRAMILASRRHDGIVGEEHGTVEGTSGCRWIIDPIDGTSNYVRGVPVWATLIALEREGSLVSGWRLVLRSVGDGGERSWAALISMERPSRCRRLNELRMHFSATSRATRGRTKGDVPVLTPCAAPSTERGHSGTSGSTCWWLRVPSMLPLRPSCPSGISPPYK